MKYLSATDTSPANIHWEYLDNTVPKYIGCLLVFTA